MRQIVAGKVFDTDTSTEIARASRAHLFGDDREVLYRSPRGTHFLARLGSDRQRVRVVCPGGRIGPGAGIVTISPAEALSWCEWHEVDADVIEANFSVEEG